MRRAHGPWEGSWRLSPPNTPGWAQGWSLAFQEYLRGESGPVGPCISREHQWTFWPLWAFWPLCSDTPYRCQDQRELDQKRTRLQSGQCSLHPPDSEVSGWGPQGHKRTWISTVFSLSSPSTSCSQEVTTPGITSLLFMLDETVTHKRWCTWICILCFLPRWCILVIHWPSMSGHPEVSFFVTAAECMPYLFTWPPLDGEFDGFHALLL